MHKLVSSSFATHVGQLPSQSQSQGHKASECEASGQVSVQVDVVSSAGRVADFDCDVPGLHAKHQGNIVLTQRRGGCLSTS